MFSAKKRCRNFHLQGDLLHSVRKTIRLNVPFGAAGPRKRLRGSAAFAFAAAAGGGFRVAPGPGLGLLRSSAARGGQSPAGLSAGWKRGVCPGGGCHSAKAAAASAGSAGAVVRGAARVVWLLPCSPRPRPRRCAAVETVTSPMEREDGSLPPPPALSRTTHVLRCPVRLAGRRCDALSSTSQVPGQLPAHPGECAGRTMCGS